MQYLTVKTLVFGILIDVPLVVGGFLFMYRYRKQLAEKILKLPIPPIVLFLIVSIPLIIFEEDIDCMPGWCGQVLIPPTLPFLLVEILVLGIIGLRLHLKKAGRLTFAYTVFGILWELFLGGLVGAPVIIAALLAPYVMVGYAFVSLLPLTILLEGKKAEKQQPPLPSMELPLPVPGINSGLQKDEANS